MWTDPPTPVPNMPVTVNGIPRMTTAARPAWAAPLIGSVYFDTTTNKLVIAGAAAWETVTSV